MNKEPRMWINVEDEIVNRLMKEVIYNTMTGNICLRIIRQISQKLFTELITEKKGEIESFQKEYEMGILHEKFATTEILKRQYFINEIQERLVVE